MNALKNSVQLMGNLGREVELKTFDNDKKIARVSVATSDTYKNNQGEKVVETQWHNLVAWGKTAELMARLLEKGNEVLVQGKLVHRSWEDREGRTRYISEIVVSDFIKLTKLKDRERKEAATQTA